MFPPLMALGSKVTAATPCCQLTPREPLFLERARPFLGAAGEVFSLRSRAPQPARSFRLAGAFFPARGRGVVFGVRAPPKVGIAIPLGRPMSVRAGDSSWVPSVSARLYRPIALALEARGIDADAVFAEFGMPSPGSVGWDV